MDEGGTLRIDANLQLTRIVHGARPELTAGIGSIVMTFSDAGDIAVDAGRAGVVRAQEPGVAIAISRNYLMQTFPYGLPEGLERAMRTRERLSADPASRILDVLAQVHNCRLGKHLQPIFLASKAYELLALGLDQLEQQSSEVVLSHADIERLRHARSILRESLIDPPSIIALARAVGINDFKLKKGFKSLFGQTPYGYLKDCRMSVAYGEVLKARHPVSAIAQLVGYSNAGHFAAAFRARFGIGPHDLKRKSMASHCALMSGE